MDSVLLDEPRESGGRWVLSQVLKRFYNCDGVFVLHTKWIHCLTGYSDIHIV